jgi:ribokinase
VVVGSFSLDLTARVSRMPLVGETLLGTGFQMVPGGKGNNQAVAAARAGVPTACVGCLGQDDFGERVLEFARSQGLDVSHLSTQAGAATGVAQITVDDSGQNAIVVVPGANWTLTPALVRAAAPLIRGAGVLLTQLEVPLEAVQEAIQLARGAGVRTVLNPAPARPLPDALLAQVELCAPNEHEAGQLTGISVESPASALRAAEVLMGRGCRSVVVTLGARGAVYLDGARRLLVPPLPVTAVDSVAAGDAFCGTLAASLARGEDVEAALLKASAAGGLATTRAGATSSLPTEAEVERLLGVHPQVAVEKL